MQTSEHFLYSSELPLLSGSPRALAGSPGVQAVESSSALTDCIYQLVSKLDVTRPRRTST